MEFRSAPVNNVSGTLYLALLSLNRRSKGKMRMVLQECRHGNIHITNGEVAYYTSCGTILAWTLLFRIDGQHIQYIYTRVSARKRGLGTQLAQYAKQKYPNIKAHGVDSSVFEKAGIRLANNDYLEHLP